MIIFLADGRLGNQIFQYVFLKTIQKNNEKIIVCGFDDLLNVLDINDKTISNLPTKNIWIRRIVYRIFDPLFNKIVDLRIISNIKVRHEKILEKYRREITNYSQTSGFFKNITFVKLGYFQSEKFFNKKVVQNLQIKDAFLQTAKEFLNPYEKKYKVFVHIRRGDYKDFFVYGKESMLPMEYFHDQIKWFLEYKKDVFIIFLSDEPDFIEEEFDYLKNKIVSKNSYEVDFAIMTLSNGAVLSPSSFGWWGSYLMKNRDIVFAPKYWLGWKSKIDYHKNLLASFMKKIKV